jgi:hypothetical protein
MEMREQSKIDEKQQQQQHPILYFKGKKHEIFLRLPERQQPLFTKLQPASPGGHTLYLSPPTDQCEDDLPFSLSY